MINDNEDEQGYRWEEGYEKTWEAIKEDEAGLLDRAVVEMVARAKRTRLQQLRPSVRLGILRHMWIVLDVSQAMFVQDLKPTRLRCCLKILEELVTEFFDQNPISQLGLMVTRNKRAEIVCNLCANPTKILKSLSTVDDSWCSGEPSLQNCLLMCSSSLRNMPPHTSREVLLLMASLTTCDPGDISDTIQTMCREKIRCSVVGLAAELHVARRLATDTGGEHSVCLDDCHLRQLTLTHVTPPPASADTKPALIKVGFPSHNSAQHQPGKLSYCMCHLNTPRVGVGPDRGGFLCPQCGSKFCELPVECTSCGLTLVSAPHVARSYRHLLPLRPFAEKSQEAAVTSSRVTCTGCYAVLTETESTGNTQVSQCEQCSTVFCLECDLFIHETLHVCPGCSQRPSRGLQ